MTPDAAWTMSAASWPPAGHDATIEHPPKMTKRINSAWSTNGLIRDLIDGFARTSSVVSKQVEGERQPGRCRFPARAFGRSAVRIQRHPRRRGPAFAARFLENRGNAHRILNLDDFRRDGLLARCPDDEYHPLIAPDRNECPVCSLGVGPETRVPKFLAASGVLEGEAPREGHTRKSPLTPPRVRFMPSIARPPPHQTARRWRYRAAQCRPRPRRWVGCDHSALGGKPCRSRNPRSNSSKGRARPAYTSSSPR